MKIQLLKQSNSPYSLSKKLFSYSLSSSSYSILIYYQDSPHLIRITDNTMLSDSENSCLVNENGLYFPVRDFSGSWTQASGKPSTHCKSSLPKGILLVRSWLAASSWGI